MLLLHLRMIRHGPCGNENAPTRKSNVKSWTTTTAADPVKILGGGLNKSATATHLRLLLDLKSQPHLHDRTLPKNSGRTPAPVTGLTPPPPKTS